MVPFLRGTGDGAPEARLRLVFYMWLASGAPRGVFQTLRRVPASAPLPGPRLSNAGTSARSPPRLSPRGGWAVSGSARRPVTWGPSPSGGTPGLRGSVRVAAPPEEAAPRTPPAGPRTIPVIIRAHPRAGGGRSMGRCGNGGKDRAGIGRRLASAPRPYAHPHLTSPHLTSPHLTSPHLTSPHLTSPRLTSPFLHPAPHLTLILSLSKDEGGRHDRCTKRPPSFDRLRMRGYADGSG